MNKFLYHKDGTGLPYEPGVEWVFVFGSNTAGRHGGGAARAAVISYGAQYGNGFGRQGLSYALPTKDDNIDTLPLREVKYHVDKFIEYAKANPECMFFVTRVGCVLAGYNDADIAPMFKDAPSNCSFAEGWKKYLES